MSETFFSKAILRIWFSIELSMTHCTSPFHPFLKRRLSRLNRLTVPTTETNQTIRTARTIQTALFCLCFLRRFSHLSAEKRIFQYHADLLSKDLEYVELHRRRLFFSEIPVDDRYDLPIASHGQQEHC